MADFPYRCALIVGAGPGISASLARRLSKIGLQVGLAARDIEKLRPLAEETAAAVFAVDASQPGPVAKLFLDMERQVAEPDIVIYNASSRVTGPLSIVDPAAVEKSIAITTFGAFLAAQQAAKRMEPKGRGAIFFTGASAGMKGFAQSAAFAMGKFPQPQGAMRREVTNKTIRQWAVVIVFVGGALPFVLILRRLDVSTFGVTGHRGLARLLGLGLFVPGPDEAALDPDHAVMIEDHESPARRDVIRIIGPPLRFKPLDLSLKLVKPRVHMVGKLIGSLVPFGQLVDFALCCLKGRLIFRRKLHRMRVGPPHPVRVRKIEMGFGPFPALRLPQRIGFAAELCRHQQIKQRHILEIAATILGEEVTQDRATRLHVGLHTSEHRASVRSRHMCLGQQTANGAGVAVIR
jgi:NADP-dependent 3-hydroxy acid dehydrogenase YdfG